MHPPRRFMLSLHQGESLAPNRKLHYHTLVHHPEHWTARDVLVFHKCLQTRYGRLNCRFLRPD